MPLTPEDVQQKTFTPVRLREGYDMGEVDQFLDEIEQELLRLHQDNEELRTKLDTVSGGASGASPAETGSPSAGSPPLPAIASVPEAARAAARLLELATTNADQLVTEARDEATRILEEAQTSAERLENEARSNAERVEADARTRSESLDSETSERRTRLLGALEQDKDALSRELEDLRTFEREYRGRLKGYFEAQLKALDGAGDGDVPLTPAGDGQTPRRLRELLGEDA
ncbi:MAG: hypothetical protein QOI06_1279 [Nocardioidaceae bacterium]|jgi:DivIVA domain-containing protein|nr:hypothetical protein [Nocardioidaceae bacterium]